MFRKFFIFALLFVFLVNILEIPSFASNAPILSSSISLKGVQIDPQNPLQLKILIDPQETILSEEDMNHEILKISKYFLTALTIPEEDLWVNLSPLEKNRIVPKSFGRTDMGQDLLAQDLVLKQLTSSLLSPEGEIGKVFWERVYEKIYINLSSQRRMGSSDFKNNLTLKDTGSWVGAQDDSFDEMKDIIESFNKVWIVPQRAVVYKKPGLGIIAQSRLKVLMEEDYAARSAESQSEANGISSAQKAQSQTQVSHMTADITQMMREVIIPEIEKHVNESPDFSNLRQIYHAVILASWFKRNLKSSIIYQVSAERMKINGIEANDQEMIDKIYQNYLKIFEKSLNHIKEDYDPLTQQVVARKYVTGGSVLKFSADHAPAYSEMGGDLASLVEPDFLEVVIELKGLNLAMMDSNKVLHDPSFVDVLKKFKNWDQLKAQDFPEIFLINGNDKKDIAKEIWRNVGRIVASFQDQDYVFKSEYLSWIDISGNFKKDDFLKKDDLPIYGYLREDYFLYAGLKEALDALENFYEDVDADSKIFPNRWVLAESLIDGYLSAMESEKDLISLEHQTRFFTSQYYIEYLEEDCPGEGAFEAHALASRIYHRLTKALEDRLKRDYSFPEVFKENHVDHLAQNISELIAQHVSLNTVSDLKDREGILKIQQRARYYLIYESLWNKEESVRQRALQMLGAHEDNDEESDWLEKDDQTGDDFFKESQNRISFKLLHSDVDKEFVRILYRFFEYEGEEKQGEAIIEEVINDALWPRFIRLIDMAKMWGVTFKNLDGSKFNYRPTENQAYEFFKVFPIEKLKSMSLENLEKIFPNPDLFDFKLQNPAHGSFEELSLKQESFSEMFEELKTLKQTILLLLNMRINSDDFEINEKDANFFHTPSLNEMRSHFLSFEKRLEILKKRFYANQLDELDLSEEEKNRVELNKQLYESFDFPELYNLFYKLKTDPLLAKAIEEFLTPMLGESQIVNVFPRGQMAQWMPSFLERMIQVEALQENLLGNPFVETLPTYLAQYWNDAFLQTGQTVVALDELRYTNFSQTLESVFNFLEYGGIYAGFFSLDTFERREMKIEDSGFVLIPATTQNTLERKFFRIDRKDLTQALDQEKTRLTFLKTDIQYILLNLEKEKSLGVQLEEKLTTQEKIQIERAKLIEIENLVSVLADFDSALEDQSGFYRHVFLKEGRELNSLAFAHQKIKIDQWKILLKDLLGVEPKAFNMKEIFIERVKDYLEHTNFKLLEMKEIFVKTQSIRIAEIQDKEFLRHLKRNPQDNFFWFYDGRLFGKRMAGIPKGSVVFGRYLHCVVLRKDHPSDAFQFQMYQKGVDKKGDLSLDDVVHQMKSSREGEFRFTVDDFGRQWMDLQKGVLQDEDFHFNDEKSRQIFSVSRHQLEKLLEEMEANLRQRKASFEKLENGMNANIQKARKKNQEPAFQNTRALEEAFQRREGLGRPLLGITRTNSFRASAIEDSIPPDIQKQVEFLFKNQMEVYRFSKYVRILKSMIELETISSFRDLEIYKYLQSQKKEVQILSYDAFVERAIRQTLGEDLEELEVVDLNSKKVLEFFVSYKIKTQTQADAAMVQSENEHRKGGVDLRLSRLPLEEKSDDNFLENLENVINLNELQFEGFSPVIVSVNVIQKSDF